MDADVTGAEAFDGLEDWLASRNVSLAFSRMRPQARERLRALRILTDQDIYPTNRAAVSALAVGNTQGPVGNAERRRKLTDP